MDKLLIDIEIIRRFRPIAKEINADRFSPFVYESQNNDLQPVLTAPLFADFMDKFDNDADPMFSTYQKLLKGETYTPQGSSGAIIFEGIQPMLVYYSLARFIENQSISVTRFGVVSKLNPESERVDEKTIRDQVATLRSNGLIYEKRVVKYIMDNIGNFPLFEGARPTINQMGGTKFFDA